VTQNAYLAKPMGVKMSIGFGAGEDLRQAEKTDKKAGIIRSKQPQEKCHMRNVQVGMAVRKLL